MRRILLIALLGLTVTAVRAQTPRFVEPTYYLVGPLPAGDTLFIRAEPSARSETLGALQADEGPIEVLGIVRVGGTQWAEIIFQERNAFVAARFLTRVEMPTYSDGDDVNSPVRASGIPLGLRCIGTEPFWSVDLLNAEQAKIRTPEGVETTVTVNGVKPARARLWPADIWLGSEEKASVLTVDAGWCSDGMSDRAYGWRATYRGGFEHTFLMEGCCWLPWEDSR